MVEAEQLTQVSVFLRPRNQAAQKNAVFDALDQLVPIFVLAGAESQTVDQLLEFVHTAETHRKRLRLLITQRPEDFHRLKPLLNHHNVEGRRQKPLLQDFFSQRAFAVYFEKTVERKALYILFYLFGSLVADYITWVKFFFENVQVGYGLLR